mmetsp:Transcript_2463/g.7807  ORF Transcript_2463/g.7807 Transcript_2463/m.7807 type:complete len:103 (+) Transcript_2463:49-357(+)|eukprot:CAMPEP_0174235834 /NCGR_PEP_ID=MMETSP0417-20130205/5160_1 /TAXON_ID=242541 /ORGANISM="Mayorella sp, Strain BSH-02190019" /LENGTH=102 /DNA_ID=CAMNT_0015314395 /DNA_START=23 /DNA_END=331 /DNA_ORIENTATION=-
MSEAKPNPSTDSNAPGSTGGSEHVNLKVIDQHGNEVHFRIRRTTPLRKLMNSYCERQGIDMKSVRFMVDGTFVEDEDTPESLELDDGDIVDTVLQQTGGGGM